MKRFLFFVLLLSLCSHAYAQQNKIDSLRQTYESADEVHQLRTLIALALAQMQARQYDAAIESCNMGSGMALERDSLEAYTYFENYRAVSVAGLGNKEAGLQIFDSLVSYCEQNVPQRQARVLGSKSYVHLIYGEYQQAVPLLHQGINVARAQRDTGSIDYCLNNLTYAFSQLGWVDSSAQALRYRPISR